MRPTNGKETRMNVPPKTTLSGPRPPTPPQPPPILTAEQATAIMVGALETLAAAAVEISESLDVLSAYVQRKGEQEGIFKKGEFLEPDTGNVPDLPGK